MTLQTPDPTCATALRSAMTTAGITDNLERAGVAAIAMGESCMVGKPELGYSHTSNDRIREVFSVCRGLSDDQLNAIKATDKAWFNFIYGPATATGRGLGNTQPDDGYNFRGRGPIQLTGRSNYTRYSALAGCPQAMQNPDLVCTPLIGAAMTVAYIKDRYHGGGFQALLRCVGYNTPDIAATKTAYYNQFVADNSFTM